MDPQIVRLSTAVFLALAVFLLVGAAPPQRPPKSEKVVIAVEEDETVVITLGGKHITCDELNAHLARIDKRTTRPAFDCSLLKSPASH